MILTTQQLKEIYFGAYSFSENEEGYLQAFQYTQSQMNYFRKVSDFWYDRCIASTAKTLEFETTATSFSFEYDIIWQGSEDSFEVFVDNGQADVRFIRDIAPKGRLTFSLKEGNKSVIVYLPIDATVLIRNFEVNALVKPAEKGEKVLWIGDSITQGFGPLRSAWSYVSIANRSLNYDIINQGIGGYIYDKFSLEKMDGYNPDKVIVAMGTNQYEMNCRSAIEKYYEKLTEIYKDTPIYCITPIWRGDTEDFSKFAGFCEMIKEIVSAYGQVTVIDGFELVPHDNEFFVDKLHPNERGTRAYAENLIKRIH